MYRVVSNYSYTSCHKTTHCRMWGYSRHQGREGTLLTSHVLAATWLGPERGEEGVEVRGGERVTCWLRWSLLVTGDWWVTKHQVRWGNWVSWDQPGESSSIIRSALPWKLYFSMEKYFWLYRPTNIFWSGREIFLRDLDLYKVIFCVEIFSREIASFSIQR